MKAKEIRNEICRNHDGANTLRSGEFGVVVRWVMDYFESTYSTAYYLVKEARMSAWTFDHKGGMNY